MGVLARPCCLGSRLGCRGPMPGLFSIGAGLLDRFACRSVVPAARASGTPPADGSWPMSRGAGPGRADRERPTVPPGYSILVIMK
jgi:hypothetical protein